MSGSDETPENELDEDFLEFVGAMIPGLVNLNAILYNRRKRRRSNRAKRRKTGTKRDGRKGRTWQQRKLGDVKPDMFSWWKLIHKHDVADIKSRNGKVRFGNKSLSCLFAMSVCHVCLSWLSVRHVCLSCLYVMSVCHKLDSYIHI